MRNDTFAPGILTFAYAIRKQKINADLICIAAKGVSEECVKVFYRLYDFVFMVNPLYIENNNKKQREDRSFLFTRYSVLKILEKKRMCYEKLIICDADLLPLRNFHDLLKVPVPCGILNERKENVIGESKYLEQNEWIWHKVYKNIPHGSLIPKEITDRVKADPSNLGINSCIYILNQEIISYQDIINDLNNPKLKHLISHFPWPEMQYMTMKLSGMWHNLDIKYAGFNSYPNLHALNGTHFAGLKPWEIANRSYLHYCRHDDYKLWICVFINMVHSNKILLKCIGIKKIYNYLIALVKRNKEFILPVKSYPEFDHLLKEGD